MAKARAHDLDDHDGPPRVLGVDPGLRLTGYAVVELPRQGGLEPRLLEAGVLKLTGRTMEGRLIQLREELDGIIAEHRPAHAAIEKLYAHYKHPRTAILMAHARGVLLLAAAQRGLAVEHLPATEVKKAVAGYGHASKRQVQLAVQAQCRLAEPPSPPDVADAIAIALCHGRRLAVAQL